MKKISIIIPNYNNGRFIEECLQSVVKQDYPKKEIIIIDDGSSDDSVKKIKSFIKKNKNANLKLICQANLNAAIARNRGMEVAQGDYAFFLDSDDLLDNDMVLSSLVRIYEKNDIDLVIGKFDQIDELGAYIKREDSSKKVALASTRKSFAKLAGMSPMPSNKLYNLKLIRKNNLEWGNVKIGQDLNFYLKYLSLCKRVAIVDWCVYRYRIVSNSITRTYDFRIFDIVNVFNDIESFYINNGKMLQYKKYLPLQELRHFNTQMLKQRFYDNYKTRLLIIRYFVINWDEVDDSLCKRDKEFRREYCKFRLQSILRFFFALKIFKWCYEMIEKKRM